MEQLLYLAVPDRQPFLPGVADRSKGEFVSLAEDNPIQIIDRSGEIKRTCMNANAAVPIVGNPANRISGSRIK